MDSLNHRLPLDKAMTASCTSEDRIVLLQVFNLHILFIKYPTIYQPHGSELKTINTWVVMVNGFWEYHKPKSMG